MCDGDDKMNLRANLAKTQNDYSHIKVTPLAGALGAEISGVNITELDDDTFEEIHRAWLDYHVI